ncbi:MAG: class I SAM-dependent methyltransferase [Alphaproteobacteria bacterium]|nr:class I SAM-dependent methyltransferase [Alphaproteobacteria bacterium]
MRPPRRRSTDVLLELIRRHGGGLRGKRVVDVGSGDGTLVRLMAAEGARVLGVETSERQLAKATAAPPVADEGHVRGEAQALPAGADSADVVVFFNSLHHVPAGDGMERALAEAVRVLGVGGLLYVGEPVAEGPFFDLCRPVDDETEVRARAQAALDAACRRGWVVEVEDVVFLHTVRLRDYDAFIERLVSANHEREATAKRLDAHLREAFHRLAVPLPDGSGPDGFGIDQPTRARLFRKTG